MEIYEYVGCFFDFETLFRKVAHLRHDPLPHEKVKPHITFAYLPAAVDTSLFGKEISVTITGYGNNGENEGLEVTLSSDDCRLNAMIAKIDRPHITLAVSATGQAVNTKFLDFHPIAPLQITGVYGGHIDR